MSVVTVRLTENQHQRLKAMAQARGISLNKLFEQLTAQALTENDIDLRYRRMATTGSLARWLVGSLARWLVGSGTGAVGQAESPRERVLTYLHKR